MLHQPKYCQTPDVHETSSVFGWPLPTKSGQEIGNWNEFWQRHAESTGQNPWQVAVGYGRPSLATSDFHLVLGEKRVKVRVIVRELKIGQTRTYSLSVLADIPISRDEFNLFIKNLLPDQFVV